MTWAEAFAAIEAGRVVKREVWGGHLVLAKQPSRALALAPDHPLHEMVNGLHYAPYLLLVDTLEGDAGPFTAQYGDLVAEDWHEVLT